MSSESVVAPAAGWYPDPVVPGALRWWSGESWTEHVSTPAAPPAVQPVIEPAAFSFEDDVPELTRFSRDPGTRPAVESAPIVLGRDPYRDRNVLAGLALIVALLSVPATIVGLFVPLPDMVNYLVGGVPIALALLGLVASFKMGYPTRMAWLAIAISAITMVAGWVISAQHFETDLKVPTVTVTDVPGVTEIQELENGAGIDP